MGVIKQKKADCQLGLHWEFLCVSLGAFPIRNDAVIAALCSRHDSGVTRIDEVWGERQVVRLVVPFEIEYCVGARDDQVSLMHRFSASQEIRRGNENALENLLVQLMDS